MTIARTWPVPTRLWPRCSRYARHTSYHTSAPKRTDTSGIREDGLPDSQVSRMPSSGAGYRAGNNISETAAQQYRETPLKREKVAPRSKATWEHATDRTLMDISPGLGGFHHAFRQHGFRLLCAMEEDQRNADLYKENFRGAKVKVGKMGPGTLPHFASVMCLPCRGTNDPVLFRVLDLIEAKPSQRRPLIMVVEHAVSFASVNEKKEPTGDFARLHAKLQTLGYSLQWRIYDTSRFGLPLLRDRLFMVAVKQSYSEVPFEFPISPLKASQAAELTVRSILESETSVRLEELLHRGSGPIYWREPPDVYRSVVDMGHYQYYSKGGNQRILSDTGHAVAVDPDAPFYVWTLAQGGSTVGPGPPPPALHDKNGRRMMIRTLTPRELARLYGYSDDFQVWDKLSLAWKYIANSVTPRIAEAIAGAITTQYLSGPQKRPKSYWDGAKDSDVAQLTSLVKTLETEVHLLKRDLSVAKEHMVGYHVELQELKRKVEDIMKSKT